MSTLLVNKQGQVFRTRSYGKANKVGEQGETEGLIRHLVEKWPGRVAYFGQARGELPCDYIESCCPKDLNEWSTGAYQRECFAEDEANVGDAVAMIQVAGYSPTFSHIDNPNCATVQAAAVRYSAPALNIIEKLKLPRCIINNDPRTYTRDQEMSKGWPHTRPVALLDQRDGAVRQVVGGQAYHRTSCYASCESWGHLEPVTGDKQFPSICVAHAHFKEGIRSGNPALWHEVLKTTPDEFHIYGKGWDGWDDWVGELKADAVQEVLSTAVCCPVVSHTPGFYTGKPYVVTASDCIPLLHKDYPFKTSVPSEFIIRDFRKQAMSLWNNPSLRLGAMQWWRDACQPNWEVLDELLDTLWKGNEVKGFGGYLL